MRAQARARRAAAPRPRAARSAAGTARRPAASAALRAAASRRCVLARPGGGELREELRLRADRRVVRRVGAVEELLGRGLGEQRAHVERRSRATCRSGRSGGRARRRRAGRRSRSGRGSPARRGGARAGPRGRARAAAPRGRCGTASARGARRPARRRRPSCGCEKSKPGRLVCSLMPRAPASSARSSSALNRSPGLAAAERRRCARPPPRRPRARSALAAS